MIREVVKHPEVEEVIQCEIDEVCELSVQKVHVNRKLFVYVQIN